MTLARVAASFAVAAALAASPAGSARVLFPSCAGNDLAGVFAIVPGSAGAGNVVYRLRLTNTSARACFVTGIPAIRLLDKRGRPLPTATAPAHPGQLTAVRVELAPGGRAAATARFSPDIPGPGEPQARACEPTAYRLRVTPAGGGTLLAPVRPPTPVCEHGAMSLSVLARG